MPDGRLAGKTVIVTGAGTAEGVGNGQATARTLARHGASVLCVDLHGERAERVAALISEEGGTASAFQGDVTDVGTTEAMAAAARERYGRIDGLVNVVGIVSREGLRRRVPDALAELEQLDLEDWDLVLRTNVTASMLCTRAVAPAMREGGGGSIVNVGSTMGSLYYGAGGSPLAYATAKAALEGLTVVTAGALGPFGVRVNLLVIGQVQAPHIEAAAKAMGERGEAMLEARRMSGLVQTTGTPWEVADAALFLIGHESRWISAQTLFVDAGASKTMR